MRASELSESDAVLLGLARAARENAFAPISNYQVGAAVYSKEERAFSGCNVEDIILRLSSCAEVVALYKGISEGARAFHTVAVFTQSSPPAYPCGVCRQFLASWGVSRVIVGNTAGEVAVCTLGDLLPHPFVLRTVELGSAVLDKS